MARTTNNTTSKNTMHKEVTLMHKALPPVPPIDMVLRSMRDAHTYPTVYEYETCEHCGKSLFKGFSYQKHENGNISESFYSPFAQDSKLRELDGEMICPECANKMGYVLCAKCGELVPPDEAIALPNGDYVCCEDCAHELDYEQCEQCGEWIKFYYAEVVEEGRIPRIFCSDECAERAGYERCEDCGEWIADYSYNTHDCRTICESCYENNYVTCEGCGEIYPYDECEWSDNDYSYYCPDCAQPHGICSYSYKPEPDFYGSDGGVYMGVEVEIDHGYDREECAERITEAANGRMYVKSDCSLDEGIEIVSHPATLDAHMNVFGWHSIYKIARDFDFVSHNAHTCGLHVHISRKWFDKFDISRNEAACRIWALVNAHHDEMKNFARRDSERWAQYGSNDDIANLLYAIKRNSGLSDFLCIVSHSRYCAVNLTNSATIELRLFNGTLRLGTLYATLALVDGLARLATMYSIEGCLRISWADIKRFIVDTCPNDTARAEFVEYCKIRNL